MAGEITESTRASKRDWHRRNYAKSRAITKAWLARNPAAVALRNELYDGMVKQQTPAWADSRAINNVYVNARKLGLTVDHIVPLRGKRVSGLHVENNLQLLTHSQNASKKNRWAIE